MSSVKTPIVSDAFGQTGSDNRIAKLQQQNFDLSTLITEQQTVISEWKEKVTKASQNCEFYRQQLYTVEKERDGLRNQVKSLQEQIEELKKAQDGQSTPAPRRVTGHDRSFSGDSAISNPPTILQTEGQNYGQSSSPLKHSAGKPNMELQSPLNPPVIPLPPVPSNLHSLGATDLETSTSSSGSLDSSTKEFAKTINLAFTQSQSSSGSDQPVDTNSNYESAEDGPPSGKDSLPDRSDSAIPVMEIQDSDISWRADLVSDIAHSRQTSDFSWEATAQDEYKIRWSTREPRDSGSSVEYVDDYSEDDFPVDQDDAVTPTLASMRSQDGSSSGKLTPTEFPKRVQSFFPNTFTNRNTGLGFTGIDDSRYPNSVADTNPQGTSVGMLKKSPKTSPIMRLIDLANSSPQSQQTLQPDDSSVYFPPASPETLKGRTSLIPASAVMPSSTASTYYDNVPVIHPTSELITQETLPTISIQVISSRMRNLQKSRSNGEPMITLSIRDRGTDKEWWKITKSLLMLMELDASLRRYLQDFSIPKPPDRTAFVSLAPSKVDERRKAIESYFSAVTSIPALKDDSAQLLCSFLSTDIIDPMAVHDTGARKEGYLTKKGKNFGGWKMRYFVLEEFQFQYFDNAGGVQLGSIKLDNADVTKPDLNLNSGDNSYRHAFQIIEKKGSGSLTRHVLCAENDEDRDDWVEALKEHIKSPRESIASDQQSIISMRPSLSGIASPAPSISVSSPKKKLPLSLNLPSPIRRTRQDRLTMIEPRNEDTSTIGGGEYAESIKSSHSGNQTPSPPGSVANSFTPLSTPMSSHFGKLQPPGLTSSTVDLSRPESVKDADKDLKKQKKRSFFSLKKEPAANPSSSNPSSMALADQLRQQQQQQLDNSKFLQIDISSYQNTPIYEYRELGIRPTNEETVLLSPKFADFGPDKGYNGEPVIGGIKSLNSTIVADVFGVPLSQAIEISFIQVGEVKLPSVVYRCIEYLDVKNAANEEGIFRLSASTSVMRALKERFNQDADVNLLDDGARYDVHAIAGLMKLYLRELPDLILTQELKNEFMQCQSIENRQSRLDMLKVLLRQLPSENFSVLKAVSRYLVKVVKNSDKNKMTLRNISIVFAPTLNIANSLVQTFVGEYGAVFINDE
ncbi:hypothetical protein V1512DRAFT_269514 [Lipomyces arxii]|uniref:uncharacterized protein n=1 Tax=Lipomyces arxii TaxID=56418 RepID=UPI0034CFCD94